MCIGLSLSANSQKIDPKFTYNLELGLPVAVSNESFNDIMQGLVTVNTYAQYSFPFHLNIGLGVKYSYFAVNQFSVPEPVYGGIHTGGGFVKVGYDKFVNDRFAVDFGVKIGYADNYIMTDMNKALGLSPVRVASSIIEPTLGLILSADERNSYRMNIGYCIQGHGFRPTMLGVDSNGDYDPEKFNNLTQYFFVGFGYTFYFGIKASE